MWSADGRQLLYENDGRMFSAAFQSGEQPALGKAVGLPVSGFIQPLIRRNYDMMPDRKSFLMLFRPGPQIEVMSNWTNQLKQLAQAK